MKFSEMPYHRPDVAAAEKKYTELTEKFQRSTSAKEQYQVILEHEKIKNNLDTLSTIAYIRNSINTTDKFYEDEMAFVDENSPVIEEYIQKFYQAVADRKSVV